MEKDKMGIDRKDMTVISASMYEKATTGILSTSDAAQLLREATYTRTLKDKILKFSNGEDVRKKIVEELAVNHPDVTRDGIERKVRGWFNDAERGIRKSEAIELCFILNLSLEDADSFLKLVSEEGFHWREPEELIYGYALNNGLSYKEAHELCRKIDVPKKKESEKVSKAKMTEVVRAEVLELKNKEEVCEYIEANKHRLGRYHNTAYKYFCEWFDLLSKPPKSYSKLPGSRKMTAREIVRTYFYRALVPPYENEDNGGQNEPLLSAVQRSIRQGWPNEVTISQILHRGADVSRKALILLFMATDGGEYGMDNDTAEEYNEEHYQMTQDDIFLETYMRMNGMLQECGFGPLDPRSAFDWMIIFCICVDDSFYIDENMRSFLEELFKGGK